MIKLSDIRLRLDSQPNITQCVGSKAITSSSFSLTSNRIITTILK